MKDKNIKKSTKIILIILSLVMAFTSGFFMHYLIQPKEVKKLSNILSIMKKTAKDPNGNDLTFDADEVAKTFVDAMLVGDDYAKYFTKEELQKENTEGKGNYAGIGVSIYANEPKIYSVLGNSPAEKAGIKKGDLLIKGKLLDGEYVTFYSTEDLTNFISSAGEGEEMELVINRDGVVLGENIKVAKSKYVCSYVYYYDNETSLRFVSSGEEKPVKTLFAEERNVLLKDDTAHIIFKSFEGDSAEQLGEALEYFYSKGKSKLILDLRANGGGYMDCLQKVATYFINNGGKVKNLITEVKERNGSSSFYTSGNNFNSNLKNIVVLADGGTASASECLIGAMLCYKDANFSMDNLLITYNANRGDYSTFGKGIMQTTYPLLSGGALKLTTARIYWPDKKTCIHGTGVVQTNPLNQVTDENAIARAIEILG